MIRYKHFTYLLKEWLPKIFVVFGSARDIHLRKSHGMQMAVLLPESRRLPLLMVIFRSYTHLVCGWVRCWWMVGCGGVANGTVAWATGNALYPVRGGSGLLFSREKLSRRNWMTWNTRGALMWGGEGKSPNNKEREKKEKKSAFAHQKPFFFSL